MRSESETHSDPNGAPQTAAFEELALPLIPRMYNFARWLAGNTEDAEDLVQEALLKGLRGFSGFAPSTNFKAWIFRILRNTWLTSRTGLRAVRTVALEDELGGQGDPESWPEGVIDRQTPECRFLRLSEHAAIEAAMEKLTPPLLEVVLLSDVEDLKYREIATALEIPIGTVMSRLARARAVLRRELTAGSTLAKEITT